MQRCHELVCGWGRRRRSPGAAQRASSGARRAERSAGGPPGPAAAPRRGAHFPSSTRHLATRKRGGTFARERKGEEEEKAPIPVPALAFPKAGKSHLDNAARTPAWLGAVCEEHPPPSSLPGISCPLLSVNRSASLERSQRSQDIP